MADPTQKGTSLVVDGAPTLADYIIVQDSWKESDPLEIEKTKDGNGETVNYSGADPGIDASCDVVIKATKTPLNKLDQVTVTFADASTKKFLVVDAETQKMGGKPVKQSLKLEHRASMTYV